MKIYLASFDTVGNSDMIKDYLSKYDMGILLSYHYAYRENLYNIFFDKSRGK